LREEHRLRVFENRVLRRIFGPKREEVTVEWRELQNEELNDLYLRRRGADKFLAGLRRKQVTVNRLGIYSTYTPRSSIHFLAHCSNVCKPLKKKKN